MPLADTIISLTSIPPRLHLLAPVLESLCAQGASDVVLALPERWERFPGEWPIPQLPRGVRLLRCADYGPATKLLAVRMAYPGRAILYGDDDCFYGLGWAASLSDGERVRAAATFALARLKRRGAPVAMGFAGVRVPADVPLPASIPKPVRNADDLHLSAWFEAHGHAVTPVPVARTAVTPLERPDGLQESDRGETYARAADWISENMGIWPPL